MYAARARASLAEMRVHGRGDICVLVPADRSVRSVRATGDQPVAYRGEAFFRGFRLAYFRADAPDVVDLRIELAPAVRRPLERLVERREDSEKVLAILRRWVVNLEDVSLTQRSGARALERLRVVPTFRPSTDGSPIEYVIVTGDSLSAAYQAFADWKSARGVRAEVRSVSWIVANYPAGVDRAESIRRFLQDAYSNWGTTDVLLGGDVDVVPYRLGHSAYGSGGDIPTDLYYQCLDGSWNGDADSLFGEGAVNSVGGDDCDLLPEVNVGRVTAHTASEVAQWVAKVQTFADVPDPAMTTKALFLSEVLVPPTWTPTNGEGIALDGAELTDSALVHLAPGMTVTRLYQNSAQYPGALPETRDAALDSIEAGYAIIEHMGHGYTNTLSVGDGAILNADVDALTHAAQGVIYSVNCNSASFEFNAIGERFLLNPRGGAIAYIGATRYDFPTVLPDYQNEFFAMLYQDSLYTVGDAHTLSKAALVARAFNESPDRWTQFAMNLLGDPGTTMYRHTPRTLAAVHAATVPLGAESFDVQVLAAGAPVAGARVSAVKGDETYATTTTDASGHALVPFAPASTGPFTVTASASSELPVTTSASVVSTAEPVIGIASVVLNDDKHGASTGNGDALANTGETIELYVAPVNTGGSAATGVTGTLRLVDAPFVVFDSTAAFGTVGTAAPPPRDAFVLRVTGAGRIGQEAECIVRFTDNAARVWNESLRIPLYPPRVDLAARAVYDTLAGDDRDGILDMNEVIQLVPSLVNLGSGAAAGCVTRIRAADPTTVVLDSSSVIASLAPGATDSGDDLRFRVTANGAHRLFLWTMDAYGDTLLPRRVIDFAAPPVPTNVAYTSGMTDVALAWTAVQATDVAGYAVYRAPGGSTSFTRVNPGAIERMALYHDYDLAPLTRYDYQVSAIDSSGNESARSATVTTNTTPATHTGFPLPLGAPTSSSVIVANVDGSSDGSAEIIAGGNRVYALHADGTELFDGDGDPSTLGPISPLGASFSGGPTASDVDGDGDMEIAAASYDVARDSSTIYLFDARTGAVQSGWPRTVFKLVLSSPTCGDIDGDGRKEVLVGSSNGMLYAWHEDGTEVRNGDGVSSTNGVFFVTGAFLYGTAALGDLDDDGVSEIVIGSGDGKVYALNDDGTSVAGWPYAAGGAVTASPAIGDLDNDGTLEIAIASQNNVLHVVSENGGLRWQRYFTEYTFARTPSPAFADLTGDGYREVIAAATGGVGGARIYAFDRWSQSLPGWKSGTTDGIVYSASTSSASECSPVVADVDGDGHPDVLLGAENGTLNGWRHDGTPLVGFPLHIAGAVRGSPAVWDVDVDGLVELVLAGYDQTLYVWDVPSAFSSVTALWPMFQHDGRATGNTFTTPIVEEAVFLTHAPPHADPARRAALALDVASVARGDAVRMRVFVPPSAARAPVTLSVCDVHGRVLATPFRSAALAGDVAAVWDRRDRAGHRVRSGVVFVRVTAGTHSALARCVLLP